MQYHLHAHCRLVAGKSRGAIYDLKSGKVFSINQSALNLLNNSLNFSQPRLMKGLSPAQINFFDTLTQKGLGGFYLAQSASHCPEEKPAPAGLNFVWLELTAKCNNRCLHCYTDSSGSNCDDSPLPLERYLSLIPEIRAAGCAALQLIGGEPLLYPHWRKLIKKAAEENFEFIEVFTNATLLTEEIVDFFAQYHVHIATTLYADNAEVHDKITQNPGSFRKTESSIQMLLKKNVPLRIASILMKANEKEGEKIMNYCAALGIETLPPDIVRPAGRGENKDLLPDDISGKTIAPPFYISESEFSIARAYHPCLSGKLAITPNGDAYPCVFARSHLLGNIAALPLADLLASQKLQDCWTTTKDKIKKCRDCEYRYACPDCRAIAQNMDEGHDWFAAPPDCPYNPYAGVWEKQAKKA